MGRRQTRTPGLCGEGDGVVGRTCSTDIPPQGRVPLPGLQPGVWHSPRAAGGCRLLEDVDLVPLDTVQVIVQRQQHLWSEGSEGSRVLGRWGAGDSGCCASGTSTYQEGAEHGDGGEEMPDVVVVKEVEQDAVTVVLSGFSWCFLPGTGPVSLPAHGHPARPAACATLLLTCQVLSPWKKKKRAKPQTTEVLMMQSRGMSLMRSPLRSCGGGQGHRVGRSWQQCPSLPCPPCWAHGGPGLNSHLHDNVEGEVEEEVADADGQQVGSEIIWADNEAVGSAGEAGTGSGVSLGVPLPCLPSPKHVCSPQEIRQHVGTPGCLSCWAHSCHELPVLSPAPRRDGSAAGAGWGRQQGWGEAGWDLARAQLCTHSDQLMMFPMTRSTIRSCRRGGGCEGRLLWGGCPGGSLQSRGPRCQHSPRTWARCTAGRSPCTARTGSCAGCPSLWGEGR